MKKFLVLMFFSAAVSASACSIFSLSHNNSYYLAGNEDYVKMKSSIRFVPAEADSYGYAVMAGSLYVDSYPQIAINDQGLAVDWATVPRTPYKRNPELPDIKVPLIPELVKNCKNVDEVIEYVQALNIPHFAEEHLFVADAEGNSVVLEWNTDKLEVIRRDKSYQLITNFSILQPENGYYPCYRYDAGDAVLQQGVSDNPFSHMRNSLQAMHSANNYPTLYSYIFDLKSKTIILYNFHDFTLKATIDLAEELSKGLKTIPIDELSYVLSD